MEEEWRPVTNYEGCYEISNLGKLRSVDRVSLLRGGGQRQGRPIKLYYQENRYAITTLCKDGIVKSFSVHRLVALAFIPNPDNLPDIDHIDRNKHNNVVSNLRWVSKVTNQANRGMPKHNTTGEMYISELKTGKQKGYFKFGIMRAGKQTQKYFKTLPEAVAYRDDFLKSNIQKLA